MELHCSLLLEISGLRTTDAEAGLLQVFCHHFASLQFVTPLVTYPSNSLWTGSEHFGMSSDERYIEVLDLF